MITALFLKSNQVGARLISWGTKRDGQPSSTTPSHVSFVWDNSVVIESNMSDGIHETTLSKTLEKYELVEAISLPVSEEESYRYLEKARKEIKKNRGYDMFAIVYFSYRVLLSKIGFKFTEKSKNPINFKHLYFCTEVMGIIDGENYSLVSPNCLMLKMIDKDYTIVTKDSI